MAITVVKPSNERRGGWWMDALILLGVSAVVLAAGSIAREWRQPQAAAASLDLSPLALPRYALYSFARGWIAYFLSLVFTLVVGSWAFYDPRARRFVLVCLDILQSLPVMAFLPVFELALIGLFPNSTAGLELVCVLAIFTGQVWNMTFSYYDSLRGIPADFRMLGTLYNYNWWVRFWRVELPFGAQSLLYNSMVSMAGGWFFLTVTETFSLGENHYRVPGIGSYMAAAMEKGDIPAQVYAIVAMSVVIVVVDRVIWWPLVVWSRRFKLDDFGTGVASRNPLQLWFARSAAAHSMGTLLQRLRAWLIPPPAPHSAATSLADPGTPPPAEGKASRAAYYLVLAVLLAGMAWGAQRLVRELGSVRASDWLVIGTDAGLSLARVLAAVAIGTLWTVPFGIWIGLNPKLSGRLQPFIQFVASFPSPMIFPALTLFVVSIGGSLQWGAVLLILFGTQWYILFNVAGAAAAIPNDMLACSEILHLRGWRRWRKFLIPAVMPGLVTGWITATGGAWNATVVAELVTAGRRDYRATGLGSFISDAAAAVPTDYARLTAASLVMAAIVVTVNRVVWKRLQAVANDRCRFSN
jgi:NitT/TauT family transport system permease protein